MKTLQWLTAYILLFLSACAWLPFTNEIRFSNIELTERLAKRFPLEKSIGGLLDVTVANPRVETRTTDAARLVVTLMLQVKLPLTNKNLFGTLQVSGQPRYEPATHALYLDDARVDNIRMDNLPDALTAALGKTASIVVREHLTEKPLYVIKDEDLKRYGFNLNPTRIEVRRDGIALLLK